MRKSLKEKQLLVACHQAGKSVAEICASSKRTDGMLYRLGFKSEPFSFFNDCFYFFGYELQGNAL